jgi:hypothetical protein
MTHLKISSIMLGLVLCSVEFAMAYSPPVGPPPQKIQLPSLPQAPADSRNVGNLEIRALQGTPDGPSIGSTTVKVQLYGHDGLFDTIERTLDADGTILIEDIPLHTGIQPLVIVSHAGVTFQRVGGMMNASNPNQILEVTCYELTEDTPDWKVSMRHVMLEPFESGVRVTEILALENPDDYTWVGTKDHTLDDPEKKVTTQFDLPKIAVDVQLGKGFHDWCCTTRTDNGLVNHLPLMPSGAEMNYSYVVPAKGSEVTLDIKAPAATDHLMIIVPKTLVIDGYSGLEFGGEQVMNQVPVHYLTTSSQAKNQIASVTLVGLAGEDAFLTNSAGPGNSKSLIKIIAGTGGGLILLFGIVLIMTRPVKAESVKKA